jgi:hypothetical protein
MPVQAMFSLQLVLGYLAWGLCFGVYLWPRLRAADPFQAQRAIATLHSFRIFGLVFLIPGVVGPGLPSDFARFAAYGDLATGLLAMAALVAARTRAFWGFVVAFNAVGVLDLVVDYYHAIGSGLPQLAGTLGATYAIPVLYVPLLMITHLAALRLLMRPRQFEAFL